MIPIGVMYWKDMSLLIKHNLIQMRIPFRLKDEDYFNLNNALKSEIRSRLLLAIRDKLVRTRFRWPTTSSESIYAEVSLNSHGESTWAIYEVECYDQLDMHFMREWNNEQIQKRLQK